MFSRFSGCNLPEARVRIMQSSDYSTLNEQVHAGHNDHVDRPLSGIRVLAIENFVAAPFATMWLADAGAEVIKIETREGGDHARANSPVKLGVDGKPHGLSFFRTNRNKKSITLDLKNPDGQRVFKELVAE